MSPSLLKFISNFSMVLGFASIIAAIIIWLFHGGHEATFETRTHAELFSIFLGLWAPTFFILSNRIDRYADEMEN